MFRVMIKFLKVLGIACAIGVLIRVGEVLIIKHNENNAKEIQQVTETINDNIVAEEINDNKETIENIDAVIENKETKQEEKVEVKEKKEAEQVIVPKTTKNTKTEQKQETKEEIDNNKQEQIAEEKQEISNTQTLPETTKQEVIKEEEIQTDEKYTEIEVDVAEKKECNGNNHGIGVGNSGKWFNTKDEAIATYKKEIKIWGDKWTDIDNPISDEEYYKNCPIRL